MAKYKRGFVSEAKEQIHSEQEQTRLHEKYDAPEDTMIVEKSNMGKFLIRALGIFVRVVALVTLAVLATIGLVALIYPATRSALNDVLQGVLMQLHQFGVR